MSTENTAPANGAKTPARRRNGKPAVTVEQALLPTAMNLDDLEREGRIEPFAFIHNGRQYILNDPQDQDWQQLVVSMSNPVLFLRLVLNPEDKDAFFENSMPAWKLNALTRAYRAHYGMPEMGESEGLPL